MERGLGEGLSLSEDNDLDDVCAHMICTGETSGRGEGSELVNITPTHFTALSKVGSVSWENVHRDSSGA